MWNVLKQSVAAIFAANASLFLHVLQRYIRTRRFLR